MVVPEVSERPWRRLPSWPERLAEYLVASSKVPFAWGSNDCVLFAAGAVEAMTGRRPFMPLWTDVRSALRQLNSFGGLVGAVASTGMPEVRRPACASRGDVLLIQGVRRQYLAVCVGHVWAMPGYTGLRYGPMQAAVRGWKVG
jgi:hypothetical protein